MFNSNHKESYYRQRGIPSQMVCSTLSKEKTIYHHALSNLSQMDYIFDKVLRIAQMEQKAERKDPHQEKQLFEMKSELAFNEQMIDHEQKVNQNLKKNLEEKNKILQCFSEQIRFRIQQDKKKDSFLKLPSLRNPSTINGDKKYLAKKEQLQCQNAFQKSEIHEEDKKQNESDQKHQLLLKQYEDMKKEKEACDHAIQLLKKEKNEIKKISLQNNIKKIKKIHELQNQIGAIKRKQKLSRYDENESKEKESQVNNCKEEIKKPQSQENYEYGSKKQNSQQVQKLSEIERIHYLSQKIELQELQLSRLKSQKDKRDETKQLILKNLKDERETNKILEDKLYLFESENEQLRQKLKEKSETQSVKDQQESLSCLNFKECNSHKKQETMIEILKSNQKEKSCLSRSQSQSENRKEQSKQQ